MDFADAIKSHAKCVMERKDKTATEQAAKMSLIVPFFKVLGYDPYDPLVVIPEYTADFGKKKECKVDYAIKHGDDIVIIVEAKKVGDPLDGSREVQLQQYFNSLLSVKFAILTDGVNYKFFTDLDDNNVMDKKPFMTFDFSAIDETLIPELKKFCSDCFGVEAIRRGAQRLKYLGVLKELVAEEMETPSDGLVKHFACQVYNGKLTTNVVGAFKDLVKIVLDNHINDVLNARLTEVMKPKSTPPPPEGGEIDGPRIETTQDEIDGFNIVKAIMSKVVEPSRVVMKDAASYCAILMDGKNNKPICRMHFNAASVKYLETFDAAKKGTKHRIEKVQDIYKVENELRATAGYYGKSE